MQIRRSLREEGWSRDRKGIELIRNGAAVTRAAMHQLLSASIWLDKFCAFDLSASQTFLSVDQSIGTRIGSDISSCAIMNLPAPELYISMYLMPGLNTAKNYTHAWRSVRNHVARMSPGKPFSVVQTEHAALLQLLLLEVCRNREEVVLHRLIRWLQQSEHPAVHGSKFECQVAACTYKYI